MEVSNKEPALAHNPWGVLPMQREAKKGNTAAFYKGILSAISLIAIVAQRLQTLVAGAVSEWFGVESRCPHTRVEWWSFRKDRT